MRRILRIDRSIGLFQRQSNARVPSTYLCLACQHQTNRISTSSVRAASSDDKTPFTEKVRRKIWGTDQPPGLEDPYGDASVFDKTKKGPREEEAQARKQEPAEAPLEVEEPIADNEMPSPELQAITWEGLRWVGGESGWQPEENFKGFLPPSAETSPGEIIVVLHRAIVETFALRQVGKPLDELSTHPPKLDCFGNWTDDVQIIPSSNGATIQMPEHTLLQNLMESATPEVDEELNESEPTESQELVDADRSELAPEESAWTEPIQEATEPIEAKEQSFEDQDLEYESVGRTFEEVINSWDPSWLKISLENPEVKFAVLKRTMQLSGIRIPDAAIKSSHSANSLLNTLIAPPKPRKLAEALEQKDDLIQLPNVKIYDAKRTFYDKEVDIGRFKVIAEELRARGTDL